MVRFKLTCGPRTLRRAFYRGLPNMRESAFVFRSAILTVNPLKPLKPSCVPHTSGFARRKADHKTEGKPQPG